MRQKCRCIDFKTHAGFFGFGDGKFLAPQNTALLHGRRVERVVFRNLKPLIIDLVGRNAKSGAETMFPTPLFSRHISVFAHHIPISERTIRVDVDGQSPPTVIGIVHGPRLLLTMGTQGFDTSAYT